jgi:hypothetical protein
MRGAGDFLATVTRREKALAAALFAVDATGDLASLGQFP